MTEQFRGARCSENARPTFSFVVPVFNTRPYLEACLTSILRQTVTDLEVIVVDDGSTDDSAGIAQRFIGGEISVIVLEQANAGQGAARNLGLARASGEFVVFVDSDDTIEPNLCERVLTAFASDIDVVSYGLRFETASRRVVAQRSVRGPFVCRPPDLLADAMLDRNFLTSPCNKVYRRAFIEQHEIRFPELGAYEDVLFSRHVALRARGVAYITDILYKATVREGSTSRTLTVDRFHTAVKLIALERELLDGQVSNAIFGAHVLTLFSHLLILATFRMQDRDTWQECYRLAQGEGFERYAADPAVQAHLKVSKRMQVGLVRHPRALFAFARIAKAIGYIPY